MQKLSYIVAATAAWVLCSPLALAQEACMVELWIEECPEDYLHCTDEEVGNYPVCDGEGRHWVGGWIVFERPDISWVGKIDTPEVPAWIEFQAPCSERVECQLHFMYPICVPGQVLGWAGDVWHFRLNQEAETCPAWVKAASEDQVASACCD